MKLKLPQILIVLLLLLSSIKLSAQEPNDKGRPFKISKPKSVIQVPSIASRINELSPVNFLEQKGIKEMQDGRSRLRPEKARVIPGKGLTIDDPLAALQRNAKQASMSTPEFIFQTTETIYSPSDPTGAVGPNHYVAVCNLAFRVFDKSGNPLTELLPPHPSIFPNEGIGDLTISYDNVAERWVASILRLGDTDTQIAVSNGPDPINDGWTVYTYDQIFDSQKLSVWHDGYYMTDNSSGVIHVLERSKMLDGSLSANIVSFTLPDWQDPGRFDSPQFLNLSHDATITGPATMIYMADDAWASVSEDDHIKLWNVTMDWADPNNSIIDGPTRLGVDATGTADGTITPFNNVFDGGSFTNLEQPGGRSIDALQATIMNQAQFRKFDTYNSALFNFVVDTDGSAGKLAGIRWYELRQNGDGQPWTVYQEGTYTAPDGRHAWNASLIMDAEGNIGMGYTSMSGPTTPTMVRVSSYYTGQLVGSSGSGIMDVAEQLIMNGNEDIPLTRYGDYSKIDIDPSDDKTFWYVNELMLNGRKNICGVFKLAPNTINDVGIISIDSPTNSALSASETVTVTVFNFGESDASGFDVTYQIDGGSIVSEPFLGTLASGTSSQFTFSTLADFSVEGQTYAITACTNYLTDEDNDNDCITSDVMHLLSNDLAITEITTPTTAVLSGTETITVTIENFGSSDQSGFDVTYTIDGVGPVTETVTANVPSGGSISYAFTQTANLAIENQTYTIEACTGLATDQNVANNCSSIAVESLLSVCQPSGECEYGDGLRKIDLGDLFVRIVPCVSGYENLTEYTTDLDRLAGNNIHNGILQTGYAEEHISMWIDFNDNGDFTDPGELILDTFVVPNGGENTDQAFTITIPTDANLGSHILRVRGHDPVFTDLGLLNNPCDNLDFGSTVDFSVNIVESTLSTDDFRTNDSALNIITKPNNQYDIVLSTPYAEDLTFNLYNLLGQQLVYGVISKDNEGKYVYNLDMSYASSGAYIIKVGRDNNFKTGKIIVK